MARKPVLSDLSLRIDDDDRIALLGANGQGKSTLAKLIAGRMKPMQGAAERHSKLKVGFFAQHQLDDLVPDETPVQHLQARLPDLPPAQIRSRLASRGLVRKRRRPSRDRSPAGRRRDC